MDRIMNQQQFDQAAYLRRIKYDGETEPTVDTLKALHHAQLYTIPFENFDIQTVKCNQRRLYTFT
jgi:N-hydroxyarylamine O-acetyltransferase